MTSKSATSQVVLLLLVVGVGGVSLRVATRSRTSIPQGDSVWRLTCSVSFHARKAGAQVRAACPETTRHCRVAEYRVADCELEQERRRMNKASGAHDLTAKATKTGQFEFRAEFDIQVSRHARWRPDQPREAITPEERARYLQSEPGIQANNQIVTETLDNLSGDQPTRRELVGRVFDHCRAEILGGSDDAGEDAVGALTKGMASEIGRARAMVALCRAAKIPARLVTGFPMQMGADVHPRTWVEVLPEDRWEHYDPKDGFSGELPYYFVPVRHDRLTIFQVTDSSDIVPKYSVARLPSPRGQLTGDHESLLNILDLQQLPAPLHEPISLVLLLPLGALLTAFFRTIIGIRTFGTFTPTLLALAFVYNAWHAGLVIFGVVIVIGLVSRTLLDRLKLLLVPRLGIIMTLVILLMVLSIAVMYHFRDAFWNTPTSQTVLLPMVILTMLIERFFVTAEEDGLRFSIQLLATTLALAFVIYLLLGWETVGHILLEYPESHCFTVVGLILIGRYTGYRLTELWRFRDLTEPRG